MKSLNISFLKIFLTIFVAICLTPFLAAQQAEWCKNLPRPAYSTLQRVPNADAWFEVYKIRPGIFAIYEPHQLEEVISYLILGDDKAVLFDTGMGISNIQAVVAGLTKLPVSVVNSHTHNDHVGDNWRFSDIYGMDTDFTRTNAHGSKDDAQAELAPDEICGALPAGFDAKAYATKLFHITHWLHDGDKIDLGGRALKVIGTPGHTLPTRSRCWTRQTACCSRATVSILARSIYTGLKPIWMPMSRRCRNWLRWRLIFNFSCLHTIRPWPIPAIFPR